MRKFLKNLAFGSDARLSGLIALGIVAAIALGCTCGKGFNLEDLAKNSNSSSTSNSSKDSPFGDDDSDGVPSDAVLQSMVRETTEDFTKAIDTNDFSEIYENASTDFQSTYTQEQMKDVFKTFVTQKRVVMPILNKAAGMSPTFSPTPSIRTENGLSILVINGKYATKPVPVNFEYEYVKRGGEWKMLKLIVKLT